MKLFKRIYLLMLIYNTAQAQTISPEVISTSGASVSNGGTNIHFIIGEITVKTIGNGSGSIAPGFASTSSSSSSIITSVQDKEDGIQVKVYPNPSSDLLYLDIEAKGGMKLLLLVNDVNGNELIRQFYLASNNHIAINAKDCHNGIYFISLVNQKGNVIRKFKVAKDN